MGIMNAFRTINADSHHDAIAFKAFTPLVIDQRGIGLNMLLNLHALILQFRGLLSQDGAGLVVETAGQGQGFACVPENGELRSPKRTFVDSFDQDGQLVEIKNAPFLAIRQIAITAIEIAQRGCLNHQ
jgi:hypothetical protein